MVDDTPNIGAFTDDDGDGDDDDDGDRGVRGISLVDTNNCLVSVTYFIQAIADRDSEGFSVDTI